MWHWITMLAGIWGAAWILLWWPRLSPPWRRSLAVLASAGGLVALILAVNTEGLRESPTVAVFLLGATYVTETASASASLPYYVVTGVCLLLGFVGLAAGDQIATRLRERWLLTAVVLSWLVTAVRFVLEKVAAPSSWTLAVGVTWLAPLVGAYSVMNLKAEGRGFGALLRSLLAYAYSVRGAVAALMVVATSLRLGSHYDVSSLTRVRSPFGDRVLVFEPGSFEQLLFMGVLPQLVAWPIYTVLAGLLGAAIALLLVAARGRPDVPLATAAPLGSD